MARAPRIFVADDQADVLEALRLLLKNEAYAAETFHAPDAFIGALRRRTADAVLMDLNYTRDTTSGDEGLDTIARIRAFDAYTPIVVMTAWGTIELAVWALRSERQPLDREYRQLVRGRFRKRDVRPREGRVHGREDRPRRPFRARRWGNAVSRRDRQHPGGAARAPIARPRRRGGGA